jgi:RNA-directed DNA polymerase
MLHLISHPQWLYQAAKVTLYYTPEVDGMTKIRFQINLTTHLDEIKNYLLSGDYHTIPGRRIYIPKANGKQRPLSIPTLRESIVQRAINMAM